MDAKLLTGVKHPEKVQAVAKVMCHSHFGYHRIAVINNAVVLLDHQIDKQSEEDWQELGGRKSRCSTTVECFKKLRLGTVPKALHAHLQSAKTKRNERRWARHQKLTATNHNQMGGTNFSRMRFYVRLLLKHRCRYESIKKATDLSNMYIHNGHNCYAWGTSGLKHADTISANAAEQQPVLLTLTVGLTKGWRKSINRLAVPVIDGYLVLGIHSRTNDTAKTFTAQVLVETKKASSSNPYHTYEWLFETKWTTIQYRNGFWYLGELSDTCYGLWRPRREISTTDGSDGNKAS